MSHQQNVTSFGKGGGGGLTLGQFTLGDLIHCYRLCWGEVLRSEEMMDASGSRLGSERLATQPSDGSGKKIFF